MAAENLLNLRNLGLRECELCSPGAVSSAEHNGHSRTSSIAIDYLQH